MPKNNKKSPSDCVWNNLVDSQRDGLCDAEPGTYSIIPGDCPCNSYKKRDSKKYPARLAQIKATK